MVDISTDIKKSADLLLHHKRIIIPTVLSLMLPIILLFAFLQMSGMLPLLREIGMLTSQFDDQKSGYLLDPNNLEQEGYSEELINYLAKEDAYNEELGDFFEEKGFEGDIFLTFFTVKNGIMFLILILIWLLGSFLFSCMSYSIIALAIKGKEFAIGPVLRMTFWFFFHLLSLRFLVMAIIIVPSIVGGALIAIMFLIHPIVGGIGLFALVIGMIVYIFYISLRLFYSIPSMYMEEHGPITSIKHSFHLTKGYLAQVVLVFLIIYSLTIIVNSYIRNPLGESIAGIIIGPNISVIGFYLLVLAFFVTVEATIFAFEHVFQFFTYLDMKEIHKVDIK